MIVRLVKDWESPNIFRQTPNEDGVWDGVKFTFDPIEECDYVIVLTRPPYDISVSCPLGNLWLVSMEPPSPFHRFHLNSYKYFDKIISQHKKKHNKNHLLYQGGLPWHINKSYNELLSLNQGHDSKMDKMSSIISNQNWMNGHEIRLSFMKNLANRSNEVDVFGRGINPVEDKFDALFPYKYSLAIENSFYNHYWTEKISDCFLSWTMPIYYGCPNINEYFPKDSIIHIDPKNHKDSVRIIKDSIEKDLWTKNLDAIAVARRKVLEKYQFFPFIVEEIKKNEIQKGKNRKRRLRTVPYTPAPWEPEYKANIIRKIEYRFRRFFNLKPY